MKEGQKVYDSEGKQANITVTHGHKVRATLEKSKLTAPSKDVLFTYDLHLGEVDEVGFAITQGLVDGHVKHEGRRWWVDINGEEDTPVVGLPKFRTMLEENPIRLNKIKKALLRSHGTPDQDNGTGD